MKALQRMLIGAAGVALFFLGATASIVSPRGDGSCSASSPYVSSCCSSEGYCGFGPDFCGDTCISNCTAVAECGQYAAINGTTCPLNVCCSQYGFCGTTADFCDTDCQSGCDTPAKPSCASDSGSATKRTIGYYESWSSSRTCDSWLPSDIDATKWTHLNFAFALIDPTSYAVAQMKAGDSLSYTQLTDLKQQNPSLQVYISIGGWDAGGATFSSMASTSANRAAFISSLRSFLRTHAFDGVDIDWEYPVASDRDGNAADKQNYVSLLRELREALGSDVGITATLPSSYWYMQHFDVSGMEPYVDWFNFMAYDLHGVWDGDNPYTAAVVQAHTNLTEINQALDLLWRNSIDSSKVVLGLGFYGRSFTLSDPSCAQPGCPFSGSGTPGNCTSTAGILSDAEIEAIISDNNLTPTLDEAAAVKYMSWGSDQWVSYDDTDTFKLKVVYANSLCLCGTMVWALDLDTPGSDTSIDSLMLLGDSNRTVDMARAVTKNNNIDIGLFWTPCLSKQGKGECLSNRLQRGGLGPRQSFRR